MSVVLERLNTYSVMVKAEYSAEEMTKRNEIVLRKYAKELVIPGFRPGKAPRNMIIARFSESLKAEVAQEILTETIDEAIRQEPKLENAIHTDQPVLGNMEPGQPFTLEIYAEIVPEVVLVKTEHFTVSRPQSPVDEEEVDAAIEDILTRNSTLEERDREVSDTDYVEMKFSEGGAEPIPMLVQLDDPEMRQYFSALLGKKAGDKFDMQQEFPENYPDRRLQGKRGTFSIEIGKVLEQVKPQLNAQFFAQMGKDENYSNEDFREEVRNYLASQKATDTENAVREKFIDALVDANPVEIPPKYLDSRIEKLIRESIGNRPISTEELGRLKIAVNDKIARTVAYEFIVDTIATKNGVTATESEVWDFARNLMISMGYDPSGVEKMYVPGDERFETLKTSFIREKTLNSIIATSTIIAE